MSLIERYLFRQLFWPTVLALSALGAVAFLSQSLANLDLIVEQRRGAWIYLQLTILALPLLLNLVLPIALYVAALVTLNRLHSDQELVICFSSGMSRWRVASPALALAMIAVIIGLVINLWVQPLCYRAMREITFAARSDLMATLVREGEFTHPAPGMTVYGRKVDPDGLIHDLFINQQNLAGEKATTYAALEGRLGKRQGQPVLLMKHGTTHSFSDNGVLNYLSFDEYIFDLSPLIKSGANFKYKPSDRYLSELFTFPPNSKTDQKLYRRLLAEGHYRISSTFYNLSFISLALAAVLAGQFNRLGYGRRMALASGLALLIRVAGFAAQSAAESSVLINLLQYLIPMGAITGSMSVLLTPVKPGISPSNPTSAAT